MTTAFEPPFITSLGFGGTASMVLMCGLNNGGMLARRYKGESTIIGVRPPLVPYSVPFRHGGLGFCGTANTVLTCGSTTGACWPTRSATALLGKGPLRYPLEPPLTCFANMHTPAN